MAIKRCMLSLLIVTFKAIYFYGLQQKHSFLNKRKPKSFVIRFEICVDLDTLKLKTYINLSCVDQALTLISDSNIGN